jgi:SRSO17 transposase
MCPVTRHPPGSKTSGKTGRPHRKQRPAGLTGSWQQPGGPGPPGAPAPHDAGVLVIDDSGDRKDGVKTAHVGHQWLGRYGKTDNGVVTVTTVRADERVYYPVHAVPYTPAKHFAKGKNDPAFRTKLAIGAALAIQARAAGFVFRAVAADSAYGDQDGFRGELAEAGLPFVMALTPRRGAYGPDAHTPVDAARVPIYVSHEVQLK